MTGGPARSGLTPGDRASAQPLELDGGEAIYHPAFFSPADSDRLSASLHETTVWRGETFKIYGREVPIPRLTAWHGDPGRTYTYSKIAMEPQPWTPPLLEIKASVEEAVGVRCNSVLLNLYRDGRDSVAWHSDDEPTLGADPVIASVSFGATRRFQLRRTAQKDVRRELDLVHGSLLVMRGATQRLWQHQVPKTSRPVGPRINLTFRTIV
jgi:alkylated DNA repair dioxygenase AlkB